MVNLNTNHRWIWISRIKYRRITKPAFPPTRLIREDGKIMNQDEIDAYKAKKEK